MMDLFTAVKLGEAVTALITLLAMWLGWVRWCWPKLKGIGDALSGLLDMGGRSAELISVTGRIKAMEESIQRVEHEVLPNGSGSLRDAVTRTESTVNMIVGQMRAHADADDCTARMDGNQGGEVEWLSRALMTWTQRTSDELKGYGWISSVHPDEREDVAEEWSRCVKHRRQFDSAFRFIDRDGNSVLVRMSGMPVHTRNGVGEDIVRWAITMRRLERASDALSPPERMPQSRAP